MGHEMNDPFNRPQTERMVEQKKKDVAKWLQQEPPYVRKKVAEMEEEDGRPFDEFELPRTTRRLKLKEDQLLLIPNHALYDRMEARTIEESDSGSDPDEEELDVMEQEEEEHETRAGYMGEMLRNMIDIDGRIIDKRCLFDTYEQASAFETVAVRGQPAELHCRVLFDYHSGYSCLDLDVAGGQSVMTCAEEHETFLVGRDIDTEWVKTDMPTGFLRGQKYSLIRAADSQLTSALGLMPSIYLVSETFYLANPDVFIDPAWYLGICSYDQALDYLITYPDAMTEGLFVIFSPRWLNLNPEEPRPFILLMLSHRDKNTKKVLLQAGKKTALNKFEPRFEKLCRLGRDTDTALAQQMRGKELPRDVGGIGRIRRRNPSREGIGKATRRTAGKASTGTTIDTTEDEKREDPLRGTRPGHPEEPEQDDGRLAALPFAVLSYTITRSYLGDFELFGQRYPTLYHLVLHLSANLSELPELLVLGRFASPPPFPVFPMGPPLRRIQRSPAALPMAIEQWATKHCATVSEPFYHKSLMQYVVRTLVNPAKALFKRLGMSKYGLEELKSNEEFAKGANPPPDEHSLMFDPRIVIKPKHLNVDKITLLGSGNFGKVYKTVVKTRRGTAEKAVIKEFTVQPTCQDKMLAFVQEIEAASSLDHAHIAKFYGVATRRAGNDTFLAQKDFFAKAPPGAEGVPGNVLLVFEYCKGKSLESFLRNMEGHIGDEKSAPVDDVSSNRLVDFLSQIARGLAYLHTRSPAIVHGDVATRNVMVTRHPRDNGRHLLKLIDFGLAKFCRTDMNTKYDNQTIPAPWLPLETLKHGELSVTTDVWSFGCVIWEMFGGTPWGSSQPMHQGLGVAGQYLAKPDKCPDFLYNLMLMCHRPQPYDRITMVGAERYLQDHWVENEGAYLADVFKYLNK